MNRFLFIKTNEIRLLDIPRVLDELGYEVFETNFEMNAQQYEEENSYKIQAAIREIHIDYVITYDFIMTVSQACMEASVPYISWIYDAPQMELYMYRAQYPCNYFFSFDKMQVRRVRAIGLRHVMHVPLAVHAEKIHMVNDTIGKKFKKDYENEITFIGQLYKKENINTVLEGLDERLRGQLEKNVESCFLKWNKDTHFHGQMSEECVSYLSRQNHERERDMCPFMSPQLFYEAAFLSRIVANRERVFVLNKLAEKYNVSFYTNDEDTSQLCEKVKVKPGVNYDVLTHIYRRSKINLNITLHCIETGVPQRVLDVMAAGGFMLSNYQEELEEMFVPGEEIVMYHNEQELEELVEYYLTHEEEREWIARKGQEKVLQEYDFAPWLEKALHYVKEAERDRKETYISMQARELKGQANFLLAQKTEQAYLRLYDLLSNPVYATTVQKTEELIYMWEMVKCWRQEKERGRDSVFESVETVSQAKRLYLDLKHMLWRIEQSLPYERCMESVVYIRQNKISLLFVAWMIYTELRDREDTFLKLAALMAEGSLVEAVRFLSQGLLFLEKNQKMLLLQANYMLQLQLWEQALSTLQKIEEPTDEIMELIQNLSEIVGK